MKLVLTALALHPSRELFVHVVARNSAMAVQSPKLVQGGQLFSPVHVMRIPDKAHCVQELQSLQSHCRRSAVAAELVLATLSLHPAGELRILRKGVGDGRMTKVAMKGQEFLVTVTPFLFMESLESLTVPVISIGDHVSPKVVVHRVIRSGRKGRRRERSRLGHRGERFVGNVLESLAMTQSAILRKQLETIVQVNMATQAGSRAAATTGTVETRHTPSAGLATVRQDTVVLTSPRKLMMVLCLLLLLLMMMRLGERDPIGNGQGRKGVHVLKLGALRRGAKVKVRKGQEQAISPGVVHGVQACISLAIPTKGVLNGVGNGHDINCGTEKRTIVGFRVRTRNKAVLCGGFDLAPCWLQNDHREPSVVTQVAILKVPRGKICVR